MQQSASSLPEPLKKDAFNYDKYMRQLNENISRSTANTSSGVGVGLTGSDFQAYLMRER